MTYLVARHALGSITADDPIVAPGDIARLTDAAAVLIATTAVQRDARDAARRTGYEEGVREGLDAASFRLFELHHQADAWRAQLLAAVGTLAIATIRQIAGEIGEPTLVAGLVERAVAARVDRARLRIRVSPQAAPAIIAQARALDHDIDVVPDAELAPGACLIETDFDVTNAGFEVQIAAIERAWALDGHTNQDARRG